MTDGEGNIDLVVLLPGKDEHQTLSTLLDQRHRDLGIRPLRTEILVHYRRDSGCFREAQDILRPYHRRARHAVVLFDHHGSGQEATSAADVEADVEARLRANGWDDRSLAVVIEPELEAWLWIDYETVAQVLSWRVEDTDLRAWLTKAGVWPPPDAKPLQPKVAFQEALRQARQRRSSAIYGELARRLPLANCQDRGFGRLRTRLVEWFPSNTE